MKKVSSWASLTYLSLIAFSACNPLVGAPSSDSNFNPGINSNSSPTPTPVSLPTSAGVIWDTVNGYLRIDQSTAFSNSNALHSGTFISSVSDGTFSTATWNSLSWITTLPFLKELPDSTDPAHPISETKTNYTSLIDSTTTPGTTKNLMGEIAGLWHLDEPALTSGNGSVLDRSGNSNHGTPTDLTFGAPGRLGTSASFNGTSSILFTRHVFI